MRDTLGIGVRSTQYPFLSLRAVGGHQVLDGRTCIMSNTCGGGSMGPFCSPSRPLAGRTPRRKFNSISNVCLFADPSPTTPALTCSQVDLKMVAVKFAPAQAVLCVLAFVGAVDLAAMWTRDRGSSSSHVGALDVLADVTSGLGIGAGPAGAADAGSTSAQPNPRANSDQNHSARSS